MSVVPPKPNMFKIGLSPCLRKICSNKTLMKALVDNKCVMHQAIIPMQANKVDPGSLQRRFRSRGKASKNKIPEHVPGTESEEETSDLLNDIPDKHSKTVKINVSSMRMDAILKGGLGISRNKIETMFYESKVRLNGEKVPKKSAGITEGDEIDIIKGVNIANPNFLTIARLEVLSVEAREESINVKIKICKSLTVENYPGRNAWEAAV